jgi:hypothetical protein
MKIAKSCLSRQIATTYSIDTDEQLLYLDKSKIFIEIRKNGSDENTKYSCKMCPNFVANTIDGVNTHILYHNVKSEQQEVCTEAKNALPVTKTKTLSNAREPKNNVAAKANNIITTKGQHEDSSQPLDVLQQKMKNSMDFQINSANNVNHEYDEDKLDSLIDLDYLLDEFHDSNLERCLCSVNGCKESFSYACDYVRHLKLKHKSTLNQIFTTIRSNIKRPKKMSKLSTYCPYCFTNTGSRDALEEHVKNHENASKSSLFTDRFNDFVQNIMNSCRCKVCDCEIYDTTVLECAHEIVKNGLAPIFNCSLCTKYFYSQKLYNTHLASDHGLCFVCESVCENRSMLCEHIKTHIKYEYSCPSCSNIYQTEQDRLNHIKDKHSTLICRHCDKFFANLDDLAHHTRYAHADKRCKEVKI